MVRVVNGPEHYAEAARLLSKAQNEGVTQLEEAAASGRRSEFDPVLAMLEQMLRIAEIHARLADTAARLEQGPISAGWARAIGRDQGPSWPERPSV